MLLERAMKLVRQSDTRINDVLSGYFSKLFHILIERKQKQMIQYVFAPNSDVLDCLMNHIYSKSISEIVDDLLNVQDSNLSDEMIESMVMKKRSVMFGLIDKLSGDNSFEANQNA